MGNLLSFRRSLEHVGAAYEQSSNVEAIRLAPKILLPGVGAFADGMAELRRLGLEEGLRDAAARGTPILGICLGMQMLFDCSEEFGHTEGLALIPGGVVPIPRVSETGMTRKIPHIGWNDLLPTPARAGWQGSLLDQVAVGVSAYFVHSFMAVPQYDADCLAVCDYEGLEVTAAVERDNVAGCQFHPEKSGSVGLSVLRRFVAL